MIRHVGPFLLRDFGCHVAYSVLWKYCSTRTPHPKTLNHGLHPQTSQSHRISCCVMFGSLRNPASFISHFLLCLRAYGTWGVLQHVLKSTVGLWERFKMYSRVPWALWTRLNWRLYVIGTTMWAAEKWNSYSVGLLMMTVLYGPCFGHAFSNEHVGTSANSECCRQLHGCFRP